MKRSSLMLLLIIIITLSLFSAGVQETVLVSPTTYVDSRGASIPVMNNVSRIVSLSPNVSETIAALGGVNLLVGRTDYCTYPAEIASVETIGDLMSPSVEKIVSLNPELVIVSNLGQKEVVEALENAGIVVAYINKTQSMEGTFSLIEDIALLIGKEKEATLLVNEMKTEIENVKNRVASMRSISVYYVAGFGQWGDFTATGDTFIHEMLEIAGGDNIAKDATNWTFSIEELLIKNPEIIILPPLWNSTFLETKEAFISYDSYKQLDAVKQNKIFDIDSDILNRQGPRSAHGVTLLSEILHPYN